VTRPPDTCPRIKNKVILMDTIRYIKQKWASLAGNNNEKGQI
jgi:hypothetical protein